MSQGDEIFDRKRQRFLKSQAYAFSSKEAFFLHHHIETLLLERLSCVRRKFPRVLLTTPVSFSCKQEILKQGHGTDFILEMYGDISWSSFLGDSQAAFPKMVGDEEHLPFREGSFDLVFSCLSLHRLNHVFKALVEIHRVLDQEGLYLASFWGGETLVELRHSFLQAELEVKGGAALRVHPMILPEDGAALLGKAGFKYPVIDHEKMLLIYPSFQALLHEIKSTGEGNSLIQRVTTPPLSKKVLHEAERLYRQTFKTEEGDFPATVDALFFTGWAS